MLTIHLTPVVIELKVSVQVGHVVRSHVSPNDGLKEPTIVPRGITLDHLVEGLVIALQECLLDLNKIHLKGGREEGREGGGRERGGEGGREGGRK